MVHTLSNHLLTVSVATHGAELQSIRNNRTGQEYLWQGDARFWGRRSPVLFPIVGSLWKGETRIDGQTYRMSQHGFARDMEFTPIPADDDSLKFQLESTPATLALFPFPFRLTITYTLQEARLMVQWEVENCGAGTMPFQIGAHPAFNYPDYSPADEVHAYCSFGHKGELEYELIDKEGCLGTGMHPLHTDADGLLPLTDTTFLHDAFIFSGHRVHRMSLLTPQRTPYLTLLFNSPLVGLWSKVNPAAPFVCIEPWWGRCDRVGFSGEFSEREHVESLSPAGTFHASYTIVIDNL